MDLCVTAIRQGFSLEMRSIGTPVVPSAKSEAAATSLLASNFLFLLVKIGAGERIRTVDPNLGKVMLYP
jgi:hypothetical protein